MPNILIALDLGSALTGLMLSAKVYSASVLVQTVTMTETPASSGRYIGTFVSPATAAAYDGTVQDGSGNSYGSFSFQTDTVGNDVNPPGFASGQIIDQTSLGLFLFNTNLSILSNQDSSSVTVNATVVQNVINAAESRVFGVLAQLRCSSGTFWKMPLTVGGVALKTSASYIALPYLQSIAHQFAGFALNKWRAILGISEDENSAGINAVARAWEKDADNNLRKIIRWAQGFTDGQYVELDMNVGAVVGAPFQSLAMPDFAGARIGPDGLPYRRIVNSMDWWAFPVVGFVPWGALTE